MLARLVSVALLAAAPGVSRDAPTPETAQDGDPLPPGTQWAQLSIRERIVIRIPEMRVPPPPPAAAPPAWIEGGGKGEKCMPADDIEGALIRGPDRVDLVMADGRRARALLDRDCPALDYYLGFYIRPTRDGLVCAGRDAIRSRSGASCPIRAFRRLEPRRPPPRFDGPRP